MAARRVANLVPKTTLGCSTNDAGVRHSVKRPRNPEPKSYIKQGQPHSLHQNLCTRLCLSTGLWGGCSVRTRFAALSLSARRASSRAATAGSLRPPLCRTARATRAVTGPTARITSGLRAAGSAASCKNSPCGRSRRRGRRRRCACPPSRPASFRRRAAASGARRPPDRPVWTRRSGTMGPPLPGRTASMPWLMTSRKRSPLVQGISGRRVQRVLDALVHCVCFSSGLRCASGVLAVSQSARPGANRESRRSLHPAMHSVARVFPRRLSASAGGACESVHIRAAYLWLVARQANP
jgi:hypothetical protein